MSGKTVQCRITGVVMVALLLLALPSWSEGASLRSRAQGESLWSAVMEWLGSLWTAPAQLLPSRESSDKGSCIDPNGCPAQESTRPTDSPAAGVDPNGQF